MNMNGFSEVNTHDGTVFVEGDMNIEGNLYVTGTYPGGGGGGVQNPMTDNLDAAEYSIDNILAISGIGGGQLLSSELNLQNNVIRNVNILEVKELHNDNEGQIVVNTILNTNGHNITNVDTITMLNGLSINSAIPVGTAGQALILGAGGLVEYKKVIFNPVEEFVDMNNNLITNCSSIETKIISNPTGAIAITSVVNMFEDINMNYHDIFNVERLTASHASVNLHLDMIPATEGKASQVLARDPAYDPLNFNTHKLVWQTPSGGGGGVTNPMTANLQAAQFSIYDSNIVECKNINIITGGGIASNSGGFAVPITWLLAIKKSTSPFYQTFNTDYITPATNLGITIDSKAPDGITDSKITLSAPNIILNNSTNLEPSLVSITGNLQITNGSGYIHGNNLIVRGRTAGNVPTDLTLDGLTTRINSTTLNITSNANVIAGNTNFTSTLRTNFIDANSGSNISILQNLSLAVGKFLQTPLLFTDAVRSNTNTSLIITGLLPDNKTQTNIILASPQISLNNQFGPLTGETQVNIAGNIVFNNSVTNPFIHGSNLIIRGRTPAGVATQLTIEGTTTAINSSTLNIFSTLANNIGGPTNFTEIATFQEKPNFISGIKSNILDSYTGNIISCLHSLTLSTGKELKTPTTITDTINVLTGTSLNINATDTNISNKLNVLSARSSSIGVRTTLFKTFSAMPFVDINTLTPIKLNNTIANQKGTNLIPAGGFINGDKFIIVMYGLLSTFGSGSLNIAIFVGGSQALTFNITNVASSNTPCKITAEIDCTVSSTNVNLANGTALLSMERFNSSIRFSTATASNIIDNSLANNTIDIYMYQSAIQTSTFTPLSYTIEQM